MVHDIDMVSVENWHSHLLSHIASGEYKSTVVGDNIALD